MSLQVLDERGGDYDEFKKTSSQDLDGKAENQGAPGKIFLQSLNEQNEDFKELKKVLPRTLNEQDKSQNGSKETLLRDLNGSHSEFEKTLPRALGESDGNYDEFKKTPSQDLNEQNRDPNEEVAKFSQSAVASAPSKTDNAQFAPNESEPTLNWPRIVKKLESCSKLLYAAFVNSRAHVEGNSVLVCVTGHIASELLNDNLQKNKICDAIKDVTGANYNVVPCDGYVGNVGSVEGFVKFAKDFGYEVLEL
jgi:hypothetical protein